ncbi:unnamed protein product [Staurois parvus]|uniref:Transposase n=1 Tax=Staurois parvus TaxID=386267 RepID=A0ABN9DR43_9NEOB|nr:unnamed protein product [Staurois parvus]
MSAPGLRRKKEQRKDWAVYLETSILLALFYSSTQLRISIRNTSFWTPWLGWSLALTRQLRARMGIGYLMHPSLSPRENSWSDRQQRITSMFRTWARSRRLTSHITCQTYQE